MRNDAFALHDLPLLAAQRTPGAMAERAEAAGAHLHQVGETLSRVRAELEPERALIGFAGAPWTVATYMLDGRQWVTVPAGQTLTAYALANFPSIR